MVLLPLQTLRENESSEPVPVWQAIERCQRAPARDWLLITQPNHAALAGELASAARADFFPVLDEKVLRAIALHDQGWLEFDRAALRDGAAPSFLDASPAEFLSAWRGSIEVAEKDSPLGGVLVSRHFSSLGRNRLQTTDPTEHERTAIEAFLREEREREKNLLPLCNKTTQQIEILVDILQFCDLLSLYLCGGATEWVVFPQSFGGQTLRIRKEGSTYRTQPALFSEARDLQVPAVRASTRERFAVAFRLA